MGGYLEFATLGSVTWPLLWLTGCYGLLVIYQILFCDMTFIVVDWVLRTE